MLIKVTQEHLDAARQRQGMVCCNCPVARAIQEHTDCHVRVGLTVANFYERDNQVARVQLPKEAVRIRDAYDFRTPITGEFDLDIPSFSY